MNRTYVYAPALALFGQQGPVGHLKPNTQRYHHHGDTRELQNPQRVTSDIRRCAAGPVHQGDHYQGRLDLTGLGQDFRCNPSGALAEGHFHSCRRCQRGNMAERCLSCQVGMFRQGGRVNSAGMLVQRPGSLTVTTLRLAPSLRA